MLPPPEGSCLPLTREVASPQGLTEGEIRRAFGEAGCAEKAGCEFSPSVACGDSSLVRGSQGVVGKSQVPRQTRGWGAGESIFCVGERGVPGGISISPQNKFCGVPREFHRFPANELPEIRRRHSPAGVQWPPGGLSVHFPPVESGRRSPRPQARPRESQGGMRPPALTARTWPPGAPPNNPGCASGWCCRPPE